ncbi:IS3 family transposase [Bacillus sp. B3-WWTP-C-10-D-3]|uniref:IS3 family transposase n=1 Tax=Bacillus TaxID=1386 RepID=UPI001262572A|nr:transposase [Bacillus sp. B3-WWTP-C-10-D-3]
MNIGYSIVIVQISRKSIRPNSFEHRGHHYGYCFIGDEQMNQGYKINGKKVQRIMKELGLKNLDCIKKYRDSLQRY